MNPESVENTQSIVSESSEKNNFQVDRIPLKQVIGESPTKTSKVKKTSSPSDDNTQDNKTAAAQIPKSRTTQVQNITKAIQKEVDRLIKLSLYYQSRSPKKFSAHRMEKLINKMRMLRNTIEELEDAPATLLENLYRQHVL